MLHARFASRVMLQGPIFVDRCVWCHELPYTAQGNNKCKVRSSTFALAASCSCMHICVDLHAFGCVLEACEQAHVRASTPTFRFLSQARTLVNKVHNTLGRARDGRARLHGASDAHPTRGGLRIGKAEPEGGSMNIFCHWISAPSSCRRQVQFYRKAWTIS